MTPAVVFVVDSGVPLPRPHSHQVKYPFRDMRVMQSFLFPEALSVAAMRSAIVRANDALAPRHFTTRKTRAGFRCWRDR